MLDSMRKAASGWLAKLLMGILVLSFAVWGIGDVVRGVGSSTLAQVGRTTITPEAYRNEYDRELRLMSRRFGQALTREQARAIGLDAQVLDRMVTEAALDERARQLGLNVSDETLRKQIMENPNFRNTAGRFDRNHFLEVLRANGLSEAGYVAMERATGLRQQLAEAVAGGASAPDALVAALHRFRAEKRAVDYATVTAAAAGDVPAPDEAALKAYYEANKSAFRTPEYRKLVLLKLAPEDLAGSIQVTDEDARAAYQSRVDRYVEPERRAVGQIVFPTREEAAAAAEKLKSGTSFEQVAEARGLKAADLSLGLKAKAEIFDPAVAEAAFSLAPGSVSEPVESRFGWALLRATEVKPGAARSFEDVKDQVKRDLAQERAARELHEVHDRVEDARASGQTLAETAEKLKLPARTIEAVDREGRTPQGEPAADLPAEADLLRRAFETGVGVEADPIQTDNGRGYLWYEVAGIVPARDRSFEEAREAVAARWREDEVRNRVKAAADRIVEAVKAGTPFEAALAEHGLALQHSGAFARTDAPAMLTRPGIEAVFATPEGSVGQAPAPEAPGRVVFRVARIETPPFDPKSPEADALRRQLGNGIEADILAAYVARLRDDIGVTINQKALQTALGEPSS